MNEQTRPQENDQCEKSIGPRPEYLALLDEHRKLAERHKGIAEELQAQIVALLQGGYVIEPGPLTASVKPNWKRNAVSWKQEYIDACGETEARKLEEAMKGAQKEISSYSLELRRTDGQA